MDSPNKADHLEPYW